MPALDFRAEFKASTLDAEKRTVDMTWTTGARVLRGFWDPYYEELSLDPSHVRMGRLQSGTAPLLDSHRSYGINSVIGVVERAQLDPGGKTGSATVRFDSGADGADAMRKVKEGILRNVSVGYRVHQLTKVKGETVGSNDTPVFRATDWEPYELSMVPIGADAGAATRAESAITNPCEFTEERVMPEPVQPTIATVNPVPVVTDAQRTEIANAERQRIADVQRIGTALSVPAEEIAKAISSGIAVEKFRAEAQDGFEKRTHLAIKKPDMATIVGGEDARDKFRRGAAAWLLQRTGVDDDIAKASKHPRWAQACKTRNLDPSTDLDPGEFRGLSMQDLARRSLVLMGERADGLLPMDMFGKVLEQRGVAGAATTGDFPNILENVLYKTLLAKYMITPDTWRRFCITGSVADFRVNKRYRRGSFGAMSALNEDGEFTNKSIPDAEKQSLSASTKGNIIAITRQALINDDMGAFSSLASDFGRSAALTIELDVYALLALNSGLGPTLTDGNTLFHASHNNITTGAALGSNAIDLDRAAMARQKDPSGNEVLALVPACLVVTTELGGTARQINNGEYDFDALSTKNPWVPNKVRNVFRDIIDTPRVGASNSTRRYLFADPGDAPTIEVAFLNGQQEPFMEMRLGWRVDGAEWKVRLDYGVAAIDFRGAITNAGA